MNKVIQTNAYIGKNGVDLKFTPNTNKAVANFSIGVKREFKEKEYDYFNVVIWGNQAEWIANNQDKVSKINIEGRLETRSYDKKDGTKVYITEIIASKLEVAEWKKKEEFTPVENPFASNRINDDITPVDDEDIPF